MATIEKRTAHDGSISYRVKVRMRGYPVQSATFIRLTDAKKWEQDTEVAIREGRYFKGIESKKHLFAEMIDRYLKEVLPLKPKSIYKQTKQLNWWKEQLGEYMLADVTSSLISQQRYRLVDEVIRTIMLLVDGKEVKKKIKRSPATVNRYTAALSHVFTVAMSEWEWVENNPMSRIKKFKESRGRTRFLSDEERTKLLEGLQRT